MSKYLLYVKKMILGLVGDEVCLYLCGVKRATNGSCEKTMPSMQGMRGA